MLVASTVLTLASCSVAPPAPTPLDAPWQALTIPGRKPTLYRPDVKDGRAAIAAEADGSVSLWQRELRREPASLGEVEFSWWVDNLPVDADLAVAGRTDAAARVLFAFDGDHRKLSARTRATFELARVLTGREPPYALLAYVWSPRAPVGTVIVHPRNDRIRKVVVESGEAQLRRWRSYRRDLAADYQRAFGEPPGPLTAVALMTDADNTGTHVRAWYGDIRLR